MIISSQKYLSYDIVDAKKKEIAGAAVLVLKTWPVCIDGDNYEVLFNGHHRLEAARELGIPVEFVSEPHPEGLTGEDLLEQAWMDSDWYDVQTGNMVW